MYRGRKCTEQILRVTWSQIGRGHVLAACSVNVNISNDRGLLVPFEFAVGIKSNACSDQSSPPLLLHTRFTVNSVCSLKHKTWPPTYVCVNTRTEFANFAQLFSVNLRRIRHGYFQEDGTTLSYMYDTRMRFKTHARTHARPPARTHTHTHTHTPQPLAVTTVGCHNRWLWIKRKSRVEIERKCDIYVKRFCGVFCAVIRQTATPFGTSLNKLKYKQVLRRRPTRYSTQHTHQTRSDWSEFLLEHKKEATEEKLLRNSKQVLTLCRNSGCLRRYSFWLLAQTPKSTCPKWCAPLGNFLVPVHNKLAMNHKYTQHMWKSTLHDDLLAGINSGWHIFIVLKSMWEPVTVLWARLVKWCVTGSVRTTCTLKVAAQSNIVSVQGKPSQILLPSQIEALRVGILVTFGGLNLVNPKWNGRQTKNVKQCAESTRRTGWALLWGVSPLRPQVSDAAATVCV